MAQEPYKNVIRAISGGFGAALAITVFYPLETVRTRLQVDEKRKAQHTSTIVGDIFRKEGFTGLYRGWISLVACTYTTYLVYFYAFHSLKAQLGDSMSTQGISTDLIFSSISGVVVVFVTNPLWVVNTRLKIQGAQLKTEIWKGKFPFYHGISDCIWKIWHQEGVSSMWSGLLPSLLLVSNPVIQFVTYEALKRACQLATYETDLGAVWYLILGGVAKLIATIITYPLQILQTRLRAHTSNKSSLRQVVEVYRLLIRSDGLLGIYRGLESKILQTVLTAALTFLVYEKLVFTVMSLFEE